jgi:hypothetical protein
MSTTEISRMHTGHRTNVTFPGTYSSCPQKTQHRCGRIAVALAVWCDVIPASDRPAASSFATGAAPGGGTALSTTIGRFTTLIIDRRMRHPALGP